MRNWGHFYSGMAKPLFFSLCRAHRAVIFAVAAFLFLKVAALRDIPCNIDNTVREKVGSWQRESSVQQN